MRETESAANIQPRQAWWKLLSLAATGLVTLCLFLLLSYLIILVNPPNEDLLRSTERLTPLNAPMPILDVQGEMLITDQGTYQLAGVEIPTDSESRALATAFLRMATAQGVEIIRSLTPTIKILRCEPRIYHWCGVDPVEAHFEQFNLNELIVALGYASVTREPPDGLTETEWRRLQGAAKLAHRRKSFDETLQHPPRVTDAGINVSDASGLEVGIQLASRIPFKD